MRWHNLSVELHWQKSSTRVQLWPVLRFCDAMPKHWLWETNVWALSTQFGEQWTHEKELPGTDSSLTAQG